MRTLLIALLIAGACSKKEAGKTEPAPAPKADTNPVAPPPPPGTRPTATPIDCESLVVAAEIATACGVDAKDVEIKKGPLEKGTGAMACMRGIRLKGLVWAQIGINAAAASAGDAKGLVELDRKTPGAEVKDVDVGDGGLLIVRPDPGLKQTARDVEATKGPLWFKLATNVTDGATAPCSDDGLVAAARAIVAHLP